MYANNIMVVIVRACLQSIKLTQSHHIGIINQSDALMRIVLAPMLV